MNKKQMKSYSSKSNRTLNEWDLIAFLRKKFDSGAKEVYFNTKTRRDKKNKYYCIHISEEGTAFTVEYSQLKFLLNFLAVEFGLRQLFVGKWKQDVVFKKYSDIVPTGEEIYHKIWREYASQEEENTDEGKIFELIDEEEQNIVDETAEKYVMSNQDLLNEWDFINYIKQKIKQGAEDIDFKIISGGVTHSRINNFVMGAGYEGILEDLEGNRYQLELNESKLISSIITTEFQRLYSVDVEKKIISLVSINDIF